MEKILSVSQLTEKIKDELELNFNSIAVIGEISNFKSHISGHWYFCIKDQDAIINCCMWRSFNGSVSFKPDHGMKVICYGKLTVYGPQGTYKIDVRSIKKAGVGELQAAFEELKSKLLGEGLFNPEFKKPLPQFPSKIAIITAIGGAALQDMLNVAKRRYPLVEICVIPTKVQGEGAAKEIAANIKYASSIKEIDVIIIGRGGGSLEDLWAFNEEVVARAIFASKIPIISAVGHEVDFSISDFVADVRAATPSVAMELATQDKETLLSALAQFNAVAFNSINNKILYNKMNIEHIRKSYSFNKPEDMIIRKMQDIDHAMFLIENSLKSHVNQRQNQLSLLSEKLKLYDISNTLQKGFVLVKQNSKIIKRKSELTTSQFIIKFFDGEVNSKEINTN